MIKILFLLIILFSSCSNETKIKEINTRKFSRITLVYNSYYNAIIGGDIHLKDLSDISMLLHEYGHVLYIYKNKPSENLIRELEKEQAIPPSITPTYYNRELQDFITTATRWKVTYPFKHEKGCLVVEELMANLFVIFTLAGKDLDFVKNNFPEIYKEYSIYYQNLDLKNKKKWM